MADDLVILAQFVKLGRLRKKVFMELAQKEISQICKLGERKGSIVQVQLIMQCMI